MWLMLGIRVVAPERYTQIVHILNRIFIQQTLHVCKINNFHYFQFYKQIRCFLAPRPPWGAGGPMLGMASETMFPGVKE